MSKLPVGLQLYTLRNETEQDFIGTLKKVKKIGYAGVEFAGYGGFLPQELKNALHDMGLESISSHVSLQSLESDLEHAIEYGLDLGVSYLVCPWVPEDRRGSTDAYRQLAGSLNLIGEKCKEAGLHFCYHHHEFELIKDGGVSGLEVLLSETDPTFVRLEADIYWARFAGEDPSEFLTRYSGRCPLVHLKDMENSPDKHFAEIGEGILDIDSVIETSEKIGVKWLIVEQDRCKRPPLESVSVSYENLRIKGYV